MNDYDKCLIFFEKERTHSHLASTSLSAFIIGSQPDQLMYKQATSEDEFDHAMERQKNFVEAYRIDETQSLIHLMHSASKVAAMELARLKGYRGPDVPPHAKLHLPPRLTILPNEVLLPSRKFYRDIPEDLS